MITPRAKAVREDVTARRWNGRSFGEAGTSWSTVVDITLCDIGGRRLDLGVPILTRVARRVRVLVAPTIDLDVQLLVRSPVSAEIPAHFVSPTLGERSLVHESWDLAATSSWVASTVEAIGPASGRSLITALQQCFWVDDPDDDRWSDVPLVDG
jgi:hypothetical protein